MLSARVQADIVAQRYPDALDTLKRATEADRYDAFAPAAAARFYWSAVLNAPGDTKALDSAKDYATRAWQRQPSTDNALLLARVLFLDETKQAESLAMAAKAVELDPMDVRIRMDYARLLLDAGKTEEALAQTVIIRDIDQHRPANSDLRLTPEELGQLDVLAGKAEPNQSQDIP